MKYLVKGFLKIDTSSDQVDMDVKTFDNIEDANEFYSEVLGDVSKDIAYNGGEFVITLYSETDSGVLEKVYKRHIASTTILL